MKWSQKYNNCVSCNSTYYKHKSKGLCSKCEPVQKEIEKLNNSTEIEIESFRQKYVSCQNYIEIKSKDLKYQKEYIKGKIEFKKLRLLRQYGHIELGNIKVDKLTLENIFNELARIIVNNDNFYTNKLLCFDTRFSEEQRKIIALKLLQLII